MHHKTQQEADPVLYILGSNDVSGNRTFTAFTRFLWLITRHHRKHIPHCTYWLLVMNNNSTGTIIIPYCTYCPPELYQKTLYSLASCEASEETTENTPCVVLTGFLWGIRRLEKTHPVLYLLASCEVWEETTENTHCVVLTGFLWGIRRHYRKHTMCCTYFF